MSDIESDEELIFEKEIDDKEKDIPDVKEKKPRAKTVMTPERLESLARARAKGLEIRKANAEARGKKVVREEKKQSAQKNKEDADMKFRDAVNARVEEELAKRMNTLNTDKINELLEEKLKDIKPRKPRKKVVYEDTETESEAEVIKVVRKKKTVSLPEPELPKEITPAINVDTPKPPPQQHQFNQFTNMLRSIPRANRNPYYN
tara:strand:+ start:1035 stop:1646 length:612 start_codon:yes stop_codon:yes gene_type:complete